MDTKICTKCGEEKPATLEFFYRRRETGKLRQWCRECYKANLQKNRKASPEKYREMERVWRAANPQRVAAKEKRWRERNPEKVRLAGKNWRKNNPDKVRERKRRDGQKNKARSNAYARRVYAERPFRKAAALHRNKIGIALRKAGLGIEHRQVSGLGIPVKEYVRWLEAQFDAGMTWSNWGIQKPNDLLWNVDHILPLLGEVDGGYLFDLSTKEDQLVAFNYLNTRPMWAGPNITKSNKVPHWDELPKELQDICTPRIKALLQNVKKGA